MKDSCYNEGTIQAFLDGELAPGLLEKVAKHLALCDGCSLMLEQAEEESAIAFAALDDGLNTLVPSERIRAKVYGAISSGEAVREGASLWERFIRTISFGKGLGFGTPVATFAALIMAVGFVAIIFSNRTTDSGGIAQVETPQIQNQNRVITTDIFVSLPTGGSPIDTGDAGTEIPPQTVKKPSNQLAKPKNTIRQDNGLRFENAGYTEPRKDPIRIIKGPPVVKPAPQPGKEQIEDDNYMRTIASLQQTVDSRKDEVLKPTQRIAYEKDMAVVDDAIRRMKKVVSKDPKNESARQVLRTSYQHKIDLLNSVAEKSELMASMQ